MRLYVYIIVCLAMVSWGTWEHSRFLSVKSEYSEFKSLAVEQSLKQEKAHAKQILDALDERDASLVRLRDSQKSAHALSVSLSTAIARGACQDSTTLDAALSRFFTEIEGYINEGDTAVINNKAWLESWPH